MPLAELRATVSTQGSSEEVSFVPVVRSSAEERNQSTLALARCPRIRSSHRDIVQAEISLREIVILVVQVHLSTVVDLMSQQHVHVMEPILVRPIQGVGDLPGRLLGLVSVSIRAAIVLCGTCLALIPIVGTCLLPRITVGSAPGKIFQEVELYTCVHRPEPCALGIIYTLIT